MHKRPLGKHHGGLWEFPGGKVEPGEVPVIALIRELNEELGITLSRHNCVPAYFAEEAQTQVRNSIVILLYTIEDWDGEPTAVEGGEVEWFTPKQVQELAKPPLDIDLARSLFGKVAS